MIYLADDYLEKYTEVLCYLIERAVFEEYSFDVIEKAIAYSPMINELERSNVTTIAFSSIEKNYKDIFPYRDNPHFVSNIYGIYGWISETYIKLFLELNITFETLFIIFPIKKMIELYPLYHEMSFSQLLDLVKEIVPYSYLDNIMKNRHYSNNDLANSTGLSVATINALRYNKRDINKAEGNKLIKISRALSVKMESLLTNIWLIKG